MENSIWGWFDGDYKAHVNSKEKYEELLKLTGVKAGGIYRMEDKSIEYDVILRFYQLDKVKGILGVSGIEN